MTALPSCLVESSALLRTVLGQAGGTELSTRLVLAREIHVSRLTRIECARAVLRLRLAGDHGEREIARVESDLQAVLDRAREHSLSEEVCELAGRVAPHHALRTLDAVHLATWQVARRIDPELELLTADRRLAAAAGVEPVAG